MRDEHLVPALLILLMAALLLIPIASYACWGHKTIQGAERAR